MLNIEKKLSTNDNNQCSLDVTLIFVSQSSSVAKIQNIAHSIETQKDTILKFVPSGFTATISESSMIVTGIYI